ncbi:37S ribosomal protein S23 mitochondrial [Thoreauomyces humboldtii]|nr:37S ribosomal protein S23 mitochondrial [Thoreauomyces humboldtii]
MAGSSWKKEKEVKAPRSELPTSTASYSSSKAAVKWAHPETLLGEFGPKKALVENLGEVLRLPAKMLEAATTNPKGLYPLALAKEGLSSFMLRQVTLDVIAAAGKAARESHSKGVIAIDGVRGVGKTVTMLQTVSYYVSEGWIVFYLPQVSQWVNGIEPFEFDPKSSTYQQPAVAARILEHFVNLNSSKVLGQLVTKDGKKVADVARDGAENPERAQTALDAVLAALAGTSTERPSVLLAVDQVNAFYCKTAYHNTDSQVITANQLAVVRSFSDILNQQTKIPNSAVICSVDRSDTQHSSPLINKLFSTTEAAEVTKQTPNANPQLEKRYHDLAAVDEFGVLLPERLAPASYDLLATTASELLPKISQLVKVQPYSLYEVASAASYYVDIEALATAQLTREYVEKELVLTGGNPLRLHRRCLSL